jgi:hypothetical protein
VEVTHVRQMRENNPCGSVFTAFMTSKLQATDRQGHQQSLRNSAERLEVCAIAAFL